MEILKMKNTLSEMKLPLDKINTKKGKIIDLEGTTMKFKLEKSITVLCSDVFSFPLFPA